MWIRGSVYLGVVLDEDMEGPGGRPYRPDGVWCAVGYTRSNTVRYEVGGAAEQRRRSLYTFWKRTVPPPNLCPLYTSPSPRDSCSSCIPPSA